MRILGVFISVFLTSLAYGQHTFKAIIKDKESLSLLSGASAIVRNTTLGSSSNDVGLLQIQNIPDGMQVIDISFVGYETQSLTLQFPLSSDEPMEILLEKATESLEEVIVTSTRSSRTIADLPTRVEFIAGEELEEKGNMKPGDIRMLLNESTGIQTQQTSATSANASIRIQGLDGRYTQILKDGFPLYAGYAGGLGLLQTPPLDLQQVEVIKGSTSTLYGGGAIAGLVNLISKRPTEERELRWLANGTSAKGVDLSGYYGQVFGRVGVTLFLSRNSNEAYDPAGINLSAIPEFERYSINPRFFFELSEKDQLDIGLNLMTEDRIGGDMKYLDGRGDATHSYFEKNNSDRFSTQLSYSHAFQQTRKLHIKNSVNHVNRVIQTPGYTFDGTQRSTFTEINFASSTESNEWVGGVNLWTDGFSETPITATPLRNYQQITVGAFVQHQVRLSDKFRLESGLRGDYVKNYSFALLPRVSLLWKASSAFSSRLGGGLGYKAPTIFTEESERIQYRDVRPISEAIHELERSYGANWDLNYKTSLSDGAVGLSVNHLFFYTYLNNPLFLSPVAGGYEFVNLGGYTNSQGSETNVKLEYADFKLFIGYTYTDTKIHQSGTSRPNPLTAKHRLNNVLMYEVEESWKVGLEAYYFSPQTLSDGSLGKEYWICGFMVEKIWEHVSLFANFENFLDARQTRFDSIYSGTVTNPVFKDIYAPVDGFVINGGIKVSW